METRHYVVATAGHVDHGKSALVRALTGIDPDRLPEEKARRITIDLGFAQLQLSSPPQIIPPQVYQIGLVDVPGHEDFLKNMVAGVGSIDAAILVVAADDGWMPQSEEHLQILTYLGVEHGVVVVTKSDLATDLPKTIEDIRVQLLNSPFATAPIVATSATAGIGIEEFKQTLAEVLAQTPTQPDYGKPRLPIDRAFVLKGVGTVVTGTLTGGQLSVGQRVIVQPGGLPARIRNMQSHNRNTETAFAGSRVALNLPEVQPETDHVATTDLTTRRGEVITIPRCGDGCQTIDVWIKRTGRNIETSGALKRPLKSGTTVHFHHATAAVPCKVVLLDCRELQAGDTAIAQLRLDAPVFAVAGDHYIIRDWPQQHTLAGGVILDARATPSEPRDDARLSFLRSRAAAVDDPVTFVASHLARFGFARTSELAKNSRFSELEISQAGAELITNKIAVAVGDRWVAAKRWAELRSRAETEIDAWHGAHPEQTGLALAALRQHVGEVSDVALIDALLNSMIGQGFEQIGSTIRRTSHRPKLPSQLMAAGERLRRLFSTNPMTLPPYKELVPDTSSQQALRFLIRTGEVIELAPEVIISSQAFTNAIETVRNYIQQNGPATVAELKTALNSNRRTMVPLLERLDRDGITKRDGDRRRIP